MLLSAHQVQRKSIFVRPFGSITQEKDRVDAAERRGGGLIHRLINRF